MFDFTPDRHQSKPALYAALHQSAQALIEGERDAVANMANLASLIWMSVPDLNWAGFYRVIGNELVLGPFIGKPACIRIPVGSGVCGAAAASRLTQIIGDVDTFPGHIACDAESRSELVIPVVVDGRVRAVIDLDSPHLNRFDADDAAGMELIANLAAAFL